MLHLSLRARRLLTQTTAFAHLLSGLGPWAFGPVVDLEFPIPVFARSSLFAYANNGFRSMPGIPAPLARYHTIVICEGNHINPPPPPTTRSPTQKYQSIVTQKIQQKYHILDNVPVPPCSILLYVYLSSYSAQPIQLNVRDCLCDQVYSLMCTGFQHVFCFIYLTLICLPAYSCSILPM